MNVSVGERWKDSSSDVKSGRYGSASEVAAKVAGWWRSGKPSFGASGEARRVDRRGREVGRRP